ncbi:MAG TPA: S-layer homology domain-containing protein [Thermoanaerobaculia bacterium]
MKRVLRALAGFCILTAPAFAATVTVTDAGDTVGSCATTGTGACTLRDAITYANSHSGTTIAFAIPGSGVQTLMPATPYPTISVTVTIDGYTQPGSSPNTNGPGFGDNSTHLIEIDCAAQSSGYGIVLINAAAGSVIRGLAINRAPTAAIATYAANDVTIEGCFLGTDPTGSSVPGSETYGVLIDDGATGVLVGGTAPAARNVISGGITAGVAFGNNDGAGGTANVVEGNFIGTNAAGTGALPNDFGISMASGVTGSTVGGTTPAARNVISGNSGRGVIVSNSLGNPNVTNNVIEGNFLGTDVTGTLPLGNGEYGIEVNAPGNTIGGSATGAGNVIGYNALGGIGMEGGADGLVIQGNFIGTDAGGTQRLGNQGPGITIYGSQNVIVGGLNPGEGNLIAFNGVTNAGGVAVLVSSAGATIRGNSIHDNVATGIDLSASGGPDGITANDPGDGDTGGNGLQNFPLVSGVSYGVAHTSVSGLLSSTPNTTFQLDFYANPPCSKFPREFLQGETYIGSAPVTTDASGNALFNVTTLSPTADGSRIAVTATDPDGNTSEFSQRLPFSVNIKSGDPAGGTALVITGTNFLPGAVVTIGGQLASGIDVTSDTSLTATTPALTPGTANDIVVTNIDETNGTLAKGFVADFLDVPNVQPFYSYVTTLVSNGITAGIGGGLYGVDNDTLRQQMAVFILKAKHGLCYTPPPCTGVFTDVPCSSGFAPWIEAMAAEGITGGCGGTNFCPQNPVRRDQMAVFLLKAEHGSSYVPPMCASVFPDVPCPSAFANWIEQLSAEGITGGCGGGNYCPGNPNTRGQMAVFITKTFGLQ